MALLIEAKDPYTHGHSRRVHDLSVRAAQRMGLPKPEIDVLNLGAGLHDIGKIGVNDAASSTNPNRSRIRNGT